MLMWGVNPPHCLFGKGRTFQISLFAYANSTLPNGKRFFFAKTGEIRLQRVRHASDKLG